MKRVWLGLGAFGVILLSSIISNGLFFTNQAFAFEDPSFDWGASYLPDGKLSDKQVKWCVANISNETTSTLGVYTATTSGRYINDCLNPDKKGPCQTDDVEDLAITYTCIRYIAEDNEVYQATLAAKKLEVVPLQEAVCGKASNAQVADSKPYQECIKAISDAYYSDKCYYANGRMEDGRTTAKRTAECVYPTVRKYKASLTIADTISAIRQGRKEANQALSDVTKAGVEQEKCESEGGTWEDKQCISSGEEGTTCAIEGMGWLICPAVRIIAAFNDALFGMINNLLDINPSLFEREGKGAAIYNAWEGMRNIANVAFVIAFMLVIYSQLTSVGISNYGVKKLLPKMFIAAILVNISFIVCALAVDLSNIIGASLHDLMIDQAKNMGEDAGTNMDVWDGIMTFLLGGAVGSLTVGAAVITAGNIGFLALLALFIPLAITALIAALTVLFILVAREAFIIILVALSPLAFVAYLLPNTEQWFDRWRKTFLAMLLLYPLVAMLFGGSQLASAVIRAGAEDALTYILSLVVLVIPLFATPLLLKFSGGLIGRVAGMINNPNKGPFDRMKKAGDNYVKRKRGFNMEDNIARTNAWRSGKRGNSAVFGSEGSRRRKAATWLSGIGGANTVETNEKNKYGEIASNAAGRSYIADRALEDPAFAQSLAGGNASMVPDIQAYSKQAVHEESVKDVKAQRVLISGATIEDLMVRAKDERATKAERAAAVQEVAERGGHQHVQAMYDYLMTADKARDGDISEIQELSADALLRRKPAGVGATTANGLRSGTMGGKGFGVMEEFAQRFEGGKFDAKGVAGMDVDDHVRLAELAASGRLSDASLKVLETQLDEIKNSDTMSLTPEQERILTGALSRQAAAYPDGKPYKPNFVELAPAKQPTPPSP